MISLIAATSERLILRQWKDTDVPVLVKINADPEVMEFFPSILNEEESISLAQVIREKISLNGWGFWAVEKRDDNKFIGFVGLNSPHYELPVSPCIEIGWRLDREYWGNGYASEAARKCLDIAFTRLNLQEVYSFTSVLNMRSRAVMERIGMTNTLQNFAHPLIPEHHRLREHVLYKIEKGKWALGI